MTDSTPTNSSIEKERDLVIVINRAAHIENLLNQIISNFCAPRPEATMFMWTVVLDTSVMSLNSKLRVVKAIARELGFKLENDSLIKVILLRNSFAHHSTDSHPVVVFGRNDEDTYSYSQFCTLDNNGVLLTSKRHEAFEKFNNSFQIAKKSLIELRKLVEENLVEAASGERNHPPMGFPKIS